MSVTAADYIESQLELEREAREVMPYDPNCCTYTLGELRQLVFACLTCSRLNGNEPIGVCYSCSIQCHSSHDIVELFTKRSFVCDCGTTKMSKIPGSACALRQQQLAPASVGSSSNSRRNSTSSLNHAAIRLNAEDIPSLSNQYSQNYKGLFCSCLKPYNPLEETRAMIQCFFGFECGEEWYHKECILGYDSGTIAKESSIEGEISEQSEDQLDKLEEVVKGEDASTKKRRLDCEETDQSNNVVKDDDNDNVDENDEDDDDEEKKVPFFPALKDFDVFVCWKCVGAFKDIFNELSTHEDITHIRLPHFDNTSSTQTWREKYERLLTKRIKQEGNEHLNEIDKGDYSLFLNHNFREHLREIAGLETTPKNSKLKTFLLNNLFLYDTDPVYEPPEEEDDDVSSTGSLLTLGTEALLSLPKEQAIQGLQAYDKIKAKLRDFFRPFAEEGKVVTEDEVRNFFNKVKEEEK